MPVWHIFICQASLDTFSLSFCQLPQVHFAIISSNDKIWFAICSKFNIAHRWERQLRGVCRVNLHRGNCYTVVTSSFAVVCLFPWIWFCMSRERQMTSLLDKHIHTHTDSWHEQQHLPLKQMGWEINFLISYHLVTLSTNMMFSLRAVSTMCSHVPHFN